MHTQTTRTPNREALQAELHREELLREAASTRRARMVAGSATTTAGGSSTAVGATIGTGLAGRIRLALASLTRQPRRDCPECA